jgi:uncharacterized protein YukE
MENHDKVPPDCPVKTRAVIERLESIEAQMKEDREARHERNAHIIGVIDGERKERQELADIVHEQSASIKKLEDMHKQVLTLLQGSWGRAGMVSEHEKVMDRVTKLERWQEEWENIEDLLKDIRNQLGSLEEWRTKQGAFTAKIVGFGSVVGAAIGYAGHWLIDKLPLK